MQMDYAKAYGQMHKNPKAFPGFSIKWAVKEISERVKKTKSKTLLDYGCGKGKQYSERRVHDQWGGIMPRLYDVGVPEFSRKPEGPYDGVICVDVMEHIEEADVERVLTEVIGYAKKFVIFHIACRPSKRKKLPDGRDVHVTVRKPDWWRRKIKKIHNPHGAEIGMKFDTRKVR